MNVSDVLLKYKDETIYYYPNPGNGGDAIIAAATFLLFDKLDLNFRIADKSTDLTDEIVVYAGGGNLIDSYENCAAIIEKWHHKVKTFILLPHTVNEHEQLIKKLKENCVFFCREKVSFEYVKSLNSCIEVYLDEDMAFQYIRGYEKSAWAYRPVKLYLLTFLKKTISFKKISTLYAFRVDVEKTKIEAPKCNVDVPSLIHYNPLNNNVNLAIKNTNEIFGFLSFYKTIHTNRLHIAIAAGILGKKVFFYSNSYYKNKAVFEFSLKDRFNIQFVQ